MTLATRVVPHRLSPASVLRKHTLLGNTSVKEIDPFIGVMGGGGTSHGLRNNLRRWGWERQREIDERDRRTHSANERGERVCVRGKSVSIHRKVESS